MGDKKELRQRVEAEKEELELRLAKLEAQGTPAANDSIAGIERELDELQSRLRGGWDSISESAARRLNDWLDKVQAA